MVISPFGLGAWALGKDTDRIAAVLGGKRYWTIVSPIRWYRPHDRYHGLRSGRGLPAGGRVPDASHLLGANRHL